MRLYTLFIALILTSCNLCNNNLEERYPILLNMVHHNPGEPQFQTRYVEPTFLEQLGYTGQVPKIEMQCGLTYDKWQNEIVPLNSDERMWIDRHAMSVRLQLQRVKDAGLKIYPFTDILVLPQSIMEKYRDEMVDENGNITILKPRTEELVRAQIEELFRIYPNLDGLTIRHGETYLHDTPYHRGSSPARNPDEHAKLINILREEICVKRDKKVFYRTWDFGMLHIQPKLYLAAMNQVEPHDNLFISIKHVNNDFLRNNLFNKTIGLGDHQQIIEISINQAGIYGRNSHPYYLGKGVIDGWMDMPIDERCGISKLLDDPKVKGFWIWTWGDGWYGPYFDNELWTNLNEYVIRQYIKNPHLTEEEIFYDYATNFLELNDSDAEKLRELSLSSELAVFYGQDTQFFNINPWLIRDQFFSAVDMKGAVKNNVQDKVRKEKRENISRWYHIEELANEITLPNPSDDEFLKVSATYGRIKYEIIEQLWTIQIMFAENELNNKPFDIEAAQTAIEIYEEKWDEWIALKKRYPCCPTLYQDHVVVHTNGIPFRDNLNRLKEILNYDKL